MAFRTNLYTWIYATLLVTWLCDAKAVDDPEYSPDILLVRVSGATGKASLANNLTNRLGLTNPHLLFPQPNARRQAKGGPPDWLAYNVPPHADISALVDSLQSAGYTAQPNHIYRITGTPRETQLPNDPRLAEQWAVKNIGLDEVWQTLRDTARDTILVGVIDTGVDYTHPDLDGAIWKNIAELDGLPDVDDDGNGYVDDTIGWDFTDAPGLPGAGDYLDRDNDPMDDGSHGTFVAGIISARTDNGIGIAGAAPASRIMILRAGAKLEFGGAVLEEDDIAAAVAYAVDNGARVLNMSFGDVVSSPLMFDIMQYANNRGVVLVASAGNERVAELLYPAAYDVTIAVGAIDEQVEKSHFTSWGENMDLVAPGSAILATKAGGEYDWVWGTSFSGPYVTAACAALLSLAPELTPIQVRNAVRRGVIDIGPEGWDPEFGFGRLHLPTLLSVTSTPAAEILQPGRPDGTDNGLPWRAFVSGTPPVAWDLMYGIGPEPRIWTGISVGVLESVADTIKGTFDASALPETTYTFRLNVRDGIGREGQDRTQLTVDHSAPVFTAVPTPVRRWLDDTPSMHVEWQTDDLTTGEYEVRPADGGPASDFSLSVESSEHLVRLPSDVSRGLPGDIVVRAVNRAGLSSESSPVDVASPGYPIPTSGFDRVATLPRGIVMPQAVDFDGNGLPEIPIKPSSRAPYDTVSFYELSPGGEARLRFEMTEPMRPSAAADLDGDGLLEIVGIDHLTGGFRVSIIEQSAPGIAPDVVAWRNDLAVGPTIGDVDADGIQDLVTLVEPDRTSLAIYEVPVSQQLHQIRQVASLSTANPNLGERFGIWRGTGDFDGDGRQEVVAGTETGDIYRFSNTGDNAFAEPSVITGDGDATRVWGGVDITGDGLANYAVLRYYSGDEFDIGRDLFQLEVYGADTIPIFTHEFTDPRTDGTGLTAGPIGVDGTNALILAIPPRLYVVGRPTDGTDGLIWYSECDIPSQLLVSNLDGTEGHELLYGGVDSLIVVRRRSAGGGPAAPTGVTASVYDSASIELTWSEAPGTTYGIWTGLNETALFPLNVTVTPHSPYLVDGLLEHEPIYLAVQAIDGSASDSVSALSDIVSAIPHAGPNITEARALSMDQISVLVDASLDRQITSLASFQLGSGAAQPRSMIQDRGGYRVVLTFAADVGSVAGQVLQATLRDSSGARRTVDMEVLTEVNRESVELTYAIMVDDETLIFGFSSPIDDAVLKPENMRLIGAPSIESVTAATGERDYTAQLASPFVGNDVAILEITAIETGIGGPFTVAAIVSNQVVNPSGPAEIVSVLQPGPDTLWIVTNVPLDHDRMSVADITVTPRVQIVDIDQGPLPIITIVVLDAATPIGPWQDEYRIGLYARTPDGNEETISASFSPVSSNIVTGHLVEVVPIASTELRLRFDTPIAAADKQPAQPIRVEPRLHVVSYAVQDTFVTIQLDPSTRVGPWGINYFVHIEDLRTLDGRPLNELFNFRVTAIETLDQVTVFPQPFHPDQDDRVVFGGLPPQCTVRLYSLDGVIVREMEHNDTGGVTWDGMNSQGVRVAAGIYLYVVETATERQVGKMAIVR
jgi:hypothetical protein